MKKKPFPYGHARSPDWREALQAALASCPWQTFPSTLGFLYVSDHFEKALEAIVSALREQTGVEDWAGSIGAGICATGQEYLDEPALALMFTDIPQENYRIFSGMDPYTPDASWPFPDGSLPYLAIVHGDSQTGGDPAVQVAELASRTGSGFLLGGITSSRHQGAQIARQVVHGGLSGVAFSAGVPLVARLSQGCSPIGPVHRVQEAQGNIVATLDRRPALEILYEEVGDVLARDIRKAAGFIFAALPVRGDDRGDYLVRNLAGVDMEHGLVAIGDYIQPGQELMFCKRDGAGARQDLDRMLADILSLKEDREIRGGLYFSCLGRGASLFGPHSAELRQIAGALDSAPLVGFFANGEISRDRIYGYTGVLALFLD